MGVDPRALARALGVRSQPALAGGSRRASAAAQASGSDAEAAVIDANRLYRLRRIAQVDKIPTATVRHGGGAPGLRPGAFIASYAALDPRDGAPVDFTGHAIVKGNARPVRIEVKSSATSNLPLNRRPGRPTLATHQRADLALALELGAVAGVLVRITTKARGRQPERRWFWIPLAAWVAAVDLADAKGQASLHQVDIEAAGIECRLLPNGAPDWLRACEATA